MKIFIFVLIFVFGLIVGSFLNSIIYRLSTKESFLFKRSYCPHCKHILSWQDLIPILSFLILKGKCRYCKKPISIQYPLVELVTAILFTFIFFQNTTSLVYGYTPIISLHISFLLFVSCLLIIIFVYDLKHYIIPDKIIYPAILVTGGWYLLSSVFFDFYTIQEVLNAIYSAFVAAAFFLAIVLISRGKWMGVGDIKLALFMGFLLGSTGILVAMFSAFFIGAIVGLILIAFKGKSLKSEVPFAPFLITGTFLAMFFEEQIISSYFNLFLIK
ncbi:MAG: prepilin peptidase [Patescibacteria group bacterium]|nr:prepilin peptidase [Patescibacteria group bacterium]